MSPLEPLRVCVAQPRSVLGDVAMNVAAHVEIITTVTAQVFVFPELSLTSYDYAITPIALDSLLLQPLITACAAQSCTALVGAPVKVGRHQYISFLQINAHGVVIAYLKTCLTPDELRRFRPGPGAGVMQLAGWRTGLAICRDTWNLRFMNTYRTHNLDLILAGVMDESSEEALAHQLRSTLARQFRVPMGFARVAGSGPLFPQASGRSVLYDAAGDILDQAGAEPGQYAVATIYPQ